MDINSAPELYEYLMVLKDAGVVRARLGVVEIEFAPPAAEPVAEPDPQEIEVPVPAARKTPEEQGQRSGYSKLFGAVEPKFTPAKD